MNLIEQMYMYTKYMILLLGIRFIDYHVQNIAYLYSLDMQFMLCVCLCPVVVCSSWNQSRKIVQISKLKNTNI